MKREFIKLVGGLPTVIPSQSKQVILNKLRAEVINLQNGYGVTLEIQQELMDLSFHIGKEKKM